VQAQIALAAYDSGAERTSTLHTQLCQGLVYRGAAKKVGCRRASRDAALEGNAASIRAMLLIAALNYSYREAGSGLHRDMRPNRD